MVVAVVGDRGCPIKFGNPLLHIGHILLLFHLETGFDVDVARRSLLSSLFLVARTSPWPGCDDV